MKIDINPNVSTEAQEDILELADKIDFFTSGLGSEEAFRKFRLTRGVYGQRQSGVQMIRIKLPYGKVTADQLTRIADCSDRYATGNLHATTRQDIQLHFVKLAESPLLWNDLEDAGITLREACGNTVRNVTASFKAGIDPNEPFDVTPHAHAIFSYFLRNPICQDMGRKFKIALSSSEKDEAFGFMHDIGVIPRFQMQSGVAVRGFKILIGGGLGAQPFLAQVAHEFLPENQLIPFIEATIRVFDRYGERVRRHKARLKYLLNDLGLEDFMAKVNAEWVALKNPLYEIEQSAFDNPLHLPVLPPSVGQESPSNDEKEYGIWRKTNVFEQKQPGFFAVQLRVQLGDMPSDTARALADVVRQYAADDLRVTPNQGYIMRFVRAENLPIVYQKLAELNLVEPGFDTTADITTCPGTDTCNLAITSSYGITRELERVMKAEFPDIVYNDDIKIKISGCMNGCGQHSIANIGFHGSSIKNGAYVLPALQVLLGGGFAETGTGTVGDKVIKIPTKRGPDALRLLLGDYDSRANEGEYYNEYYRRAGKNYFYSLLKPLADLTTATDSDYVDWDHAERYATEVGVGECASVILDLVATTLIEAEEKLQKAQETFKKQDYADAVYHAYNTFVTAAKAGLLALSVPTNTQIGIVNDADKHFSDDDGRLKERILSINQNAATPEFASEFIADAAVFLAMIQTKRAEQIEREGAPRAQAVVFGLDS